MGMLRDPPTPVVGRARLDCFGTPTQRPQACDGGPDKRMAAGKELNSTGARHEKTSLWEAQEDLRKARNDLCILWDVYGGFLTPLAVSSPC